MSRPVVHLSGIALVLATVPAWAGQGVAPQPAENPAKAQAFAYENALRGAVILGGQKLAQQASVVVPQIELATSEQPIVRGVKLEGWGFFFDVQAPDIQSTMMVWDMVNQSRRNRPPSSVQAGNGAQPVSGRVVASGATVEPDPMVNDLGTPGGADRAYSSFVREALIDALLDSSAVLPLGASDHLTIAASGIDQPGSNPLYRARKLIITIKGSDLLDLRQGRITREQAKDRIIEERF